MRYDILSHPCLHHGASYSVTATGIASTAITLIHSMNENGLDAFQPTGQSDESVTCPQLCMLLAKSLLFPLLIWILMWRFPQSLLLLCKGRLGVSFKKKERGRERLHMSFLFEFMELSSAQLFIAQLTGSTVHITNRLLADLKSLLETRADIGSITLSDTLGLK